MTHTREDCAQVYFQEDFSLSDPETFEQTCHALGTSSPVLLQEKVSSASHAIPPLKALDSSVS
jgi:hypothetical protein